jgi:hypothetical protein
MALDREFSRGNGSDASRVHPGPCKEAYMIRSAAHRMCGAAVIALLVATAVACRSSSPAMPSATYPPMLGAWSGTLTITDENGVVGNSCTHSWNVTSQSAGSVSGTSLTAGSCRTTSGTVSGNVTTDGTLSLGPNILPVEPACTRLSGGTYSGTVSASTLSARMTEIVQCGPQNFEFTRSIILALQK